MIYSYNELLEMKKNGIKLNWDNITKEQLEKLFTYERINNNFIAELYDVSSEKVRNKRRKWNISVNSPKYIYVRYTEENSRLFEILNTNAKERIMDPENIDWISKSLTHYLFRNGPVEDMHANGQLSEFDMKTLNKYMVNRIAGLLKLINDGEWVKIELMLDFLSNYGTEWDAAEFDTEDIELIFKNAMRINEEELVNN